jgi:hypothetical protein
MAKKRKAVSKSTRFEVFARDRFTCQYCGRKPPEVVLHLDHIHPVSKGGGNEETNLVTSCAECNLGKSTTELSDAGVKSRITTQRLAELREAREQLEAYQDMLMEERSMRKAYVEQVCGEIYRELDYSPDATDQKSIVQFLKRLPFPEVLDAVDATASRDIKRWSGWKYFCGVCWTKIRANEKRNAATQDSPSADYSDLN